MSTEPGRGRQAEHPAEVPKAGWLDVLARVWDDVGRLNLSLVAAGVAYYALFSLFPALAALVSVYGLVADPSAVAGELAPLAGLVPADTLQLIGDQLRTVASGSHQSLGLSLAAGLAVALWSAAAGMRALMTAMNIVYQEPERRGLIRYYLLGLGLTAAGVVFAIVALGLIAVVPAVLGFLGLGGAAVVLLSLVRWPLLALAFMTALAVLYRVGPSRTSARWRWVSWGAALATALWLAASAGFSLYVAHFASYNKTYGSVGAAVVLLLWFYITAFIVLLGAAVNAELEHQTARDTTVAGGKPMGQRGAHMADTVGPARRTGTGG